MKRREKHKNNKKNQRKLLGSKKAVRADGCGTSIAGPAIVISRRGPLAMTVNCVMTEPLMGDGEGNGARAPPLG